MMAGQENKNSDAEGDSSGSNAGPSDPEQNSDVDVIEEYDSIDDQLDKLNSALDILEQKNDDIVLQLKQLLQSSQAIRQEIKEENRSM